MPRNAGTFLDELSVRCGWQYDNPDRSDRKLTVRYNHDALGQRVAVHGGPKGSTNFTYDGEDVLLDDSDGTLTKYINGPGIDNKLRQTTGSSANYFLADHLGSTNGLTDATGALTASNSYDAFGNPTNTSFPTRYQFTGREYDSTTGLQFSRARWYDPAIGRFISEDPIGLGGGTNPFSYVGNNPLNFIDPFGLYQDGPVNYLRNPFDSSHWILNGTSNTVSDLLGLDSVAGWGWTIGDYRCSTEDRFAAGGKLLGWTAFQAAGAVGLYRGGLTLVTSTSGPRVFWSGDEIAAAAASNFAKAAGGSTLEMTTGGRIAARVTSGLPRWASNAIWRDLSARFAAGARGSIDVFHFSGGVRIGSVWAGTEYGILVRNNVSIVYHVVP